MKRRGHQIADAAAEHIAPEVVAQARLEPAGINNLPGFARRSVVAEHSPLPQGISH